MPSPALLESRIAQFLDLGGNLSQRTQTPPANALAEQPSTVTDHHSQANILKQALDLALGSSTDQQGPSQQLRTVTPIHEGLPALPTRLLHRIWANEYIDFSELPPAKSRPRSLPHHLEGRVLLVHMHELDNSKKAIPDFVTWAQCFAVYAAAILLKQPQRAADLMAYFFETANNARKYRWPSWLVYDQNFRQRMADTQDIEWAKTNPSIFTRCFTNEQKSSDSWCKHCHSVDHLTISCPHAPQSGSPRQEASPQPQPKKGAICRDFNTKEKGCRWGANCYRKHICSECRGTHPRFRCFKKADAPSTSARDPA